MAEFTLLKIQLDESSFTANAPFSGGESEETEPEPETAERGGSRLLALVAGLVGLLALVAVAFAVKKRRAGGGGAETESEESELVELDDIDV